MKILMISGTEKAGTTSLYNYFSQLPGFKGSKTKETDYFRYHFDLDDYLKKNYSGKLTDSEILFEASPGYLSEAESVALNLSKLKEKTDLHLVFILRHPAERFISSYKFFVAKGYLTPDISLLDFLRMNLEYSRSGEKIFSSISNDWFYKTFEQGFYEELLKNFDDLKGSNIDISVYSFETLKENPRFLMESLVKRVGSESYDFVGFDFFAFNKTINPRNMRVHLYFDAVNKYFEWFFLRYPVVKKLAKSIYAWLNASSSSIDVSDSARDAVYRAYEDQCLLDYSYRFIEP